MIFPESQLANKYLHTLRGIEIGASTHNAFNLNTINVDVNNDPHSDYAIEQELMGNPPAKIDIVADACHLPFADKSFDFIVTSHVIEHIWDPIAALAEWDRVATKYLFIVVPHPDRTFDKGRSITRFEELEIRHTKQLPAPAKDYHWNVWRCEDFLQLCRRLGYLIEYFQDPDDKVGNGFTVIIKL